MARAGAVVGTVKVRIVGGLPTGFYIPTRFYRCFGVVFARRAPLAARPTLLIVITEDVPARLAISIRRSFCIGAVPPLSAFLAAPGSFYDILKPSSRTNFAVVWRRGAFGRDVSAWGTVFAVVLAQLVLISSLPAN